MLGCIITIHINSLIYVYEIEVNDPHTSDEIYPAGRHFYKHIKQLLRTNRLEMCLCR